MLATRTSCFMMASTCLALFENSASTLFRARQGGTKLADLLVAAAAAVAAPTPPQDQAQDQALQAALAALAQHLKDNPHSTGKGGPRGSKEEKEIEITQGEITQGEITTQAESLYLSQTHAHP
jgi:hypothetical protein